MFVFALLIGIYSYLIFFLGLFGWLYKDVVIVVTVVLWVGVALRSHKVIKSSSYQVLKNFRHVTFDLKTLLVSLIVLQAFVNLIGALGPELGFDALWYHLMLPRLYLENHSVFYIPGGLLYYSAMPKLSEMLYITGLSFGNEILAKVIHFGFGLLTCLALYKLSRKFFTPVISLVAVLIFYANLVVAWESITAYVDLVRAFFEVMALWAFINWWQGTRLHPVSSENNKWFVWSAVMLGLAITTKLLAIGTLIIFILLILIVSIRYQVSGIKYKEKILYIIRNTLYFLLISLAVPLPWLIFSYINTGNPVYPFFSGIYPVSPEPISLVGFVKDVWGVFMYSPDPISPIYVMLLPLIVWLFFVRPHPDPLLKGEGNTRSILNMVGLYSLLAVVVWYFTPRTGGGRFLLPYLPAFSLLCAFVIAEVLENKKKYGVFLGKFLLTIIIFISLTTIGYRFAANAKYLPVIFGQQTKEEFLSQNLNFAFGDFYDIDGYFEKNIKSTDTVLLYGFHNLYYVDFPFIDSSWGGTMQHLFEISQRGELNYVATQNTDLPAAFSDWVLVYENEKTMVKLYKMPEKVYTYK